MWRDSFDDVRQAFVQWRLWTSWAWYDIRLRYRRSVIGPFWLTLSLSITICGMSFVFGAVFQSTIGDIMPHIAAGMMLWLTISSILTDGCAVFIANGGIIKEIPLPITLHSMRLIMRTGITMMHHLVIMVVIIPLFGVPVNYAILLVIPGLLLYVLNAFWVVQLFGTLTARFRDIQQVVQSVMQLCMFVTPIFWKPDLLSGRRKFIVDWNPLAHMIDIIRKPLLGEVPSVLNYTVVIGLTVVGMLVATFFFGKFRRRITYWL